MSEGTDCLDDARLDAIASSRASAEALDDAFAHAADCDACADLLAVVARAKVDLQPTAPCGPDDGQEQLWPLPGDHIGRFVVQRVVGRGGMGLVVAASDPKLGRTVAIKVLRPGLVGASLVREAQAIATVRHPNVVTVHEVDSDGDRVFLVMDFVDGPTLRGWLAEHEPPWPLVVRMFVDAGRGLAAAHQRGLVHRDFKPDNVLVDAADVPQVIDFGLVTSSNEAADVLDGRGRLIGGTPRYMAPECHGGGVAGPAADQYAFCVAMFEALLRAHPFGERGGRKHRARNDDLVLPSSSLPRRLIRLITVGLRSDPRQRHASMDVLLEQLSAVLWARRRNRRLVGGGAVVAATGIGVAWMMGAEERNRCASVVEDEQFAGVWDSARREALQAALDAGTWPLFEARIDHYTQSWSQLRAQVCRDAGATEVAMFDRQVACLEGRRVFLRTALEIVHSGRAPRTPLEIVYELPQLEPCLSGGDVGSTDAAPELAEEVERLRDRSWSALARARSGLATEAIEELEALVAESRALDDPALQVELLDKLAAAQVHVYPERGLETWREAYAIAGSLGDERALAHLETVGISHHLDAGDLDQAEFLFSLAESRGSGTDIVLTRGRAILSRMRGDLEAAESAYRRVLEHVLQSPNPAVDVGGAYGDLAAVLVMQGRVREGVEYMNRSVEETERAFGPTHPHVIHARQNRAVMLRMQGNTDEALREVRALREIAGPLEQPGLAKMLAVLLREGGKPEAALPLDREVVADRLERLGEEHPDTLEAQAAVGLDLIEAGRPSEAVEALREPAKRVLRLPPDPRALKVLVHLGWAYQDAGDLEAAVSKLEEAYDRMQSLPNPGPRATRTAHALATVLIELGRFEEAIEVLRPVDRDAAALLDASPDAGLLRNTAYQTRFALATALWGAQRREEALKVGREAAALVADLPPDDPRREESARWLAERSP